MAGNKITVGNLEVFALSDGEIILDPARIFPETPPSAWEAYRDLLTADGQMAANLGCYLLRTARQTILVDTGVGPGRQGRLLDEMGGLGVRPEDVDIVVFTHLHGDHIGWNITFADGRPRATFPRARYIIQQADWDHFTGGRGPQEQPQLFPLRDLGILELHSGEHTVSDEVSVLPTPGHTPGHACILIASAGQRAVVLGDVAVNPVQMPEPDWPCSFDSIRDLACQTRRQLYQRLAGEGLTVAAGHFAPPGFGRLVRLEGRHHWQAL